MTFIGDDCWYLWYVDRFGSYAILCFGQELYFAIRCWSS